MSALAFARAATRDAATTTRPRLPPPATSTSRTRRAATSRDVGARAAGKDDQGKSSATPRRVARRAPKTENGSKASGTKSTSESESAPKVRKVRKLARSVKESSKTRQVISVDRREREALALESFVKKRGRILAPAASGATLGDASVGAAAQEVELSSALREETTIGGEAAGDRLRRLFAERRERGMGMVRDKFNDGGAISAWDTFRTSMDSSEADEQVDDMLESAAEVEEKNRRVRDGYVEDAFGVNNAIDPFKLVTGEYVVHRKYGIGQFLGMKVLAVESANEGTQNKPFLFLKYQDATAKISPEASRRLLYRFCSPGGLVKPPKLNKLNDKSTWDLRERKTEATIRRLVVNQMVVYLLSLIHI